MDYFRSSLEHLGRDFPPDNIKILLNMLEGLVTNLSWSPSEAIELFEALLKRYESEKTKDRSNLVPWMVKIFYCIEINYITPSWKSMKHCKTLVELVQDYSVTDEILAEILNDASDKELDQIIEEIANVDKNILDNAREIVSSVNQDPKVFSDDSNKSEMKRDLQKLVRAVKMTMKITPRFTQMVSWCIMALSEKGRLIQVSTGEGKTCIVAMFAAYRALRGEKVDIMSSSPVLAERDFKKWQDFYKSLDVRVSCNINKSDTDLKKCYERQVVYGTAHDFAGDWLKHHFGRKNILGNRSFQCAIVDEVDSLMLDKGHHTVYLSYDMPALQHLNPLLARIWDTANKYSIVDSVVLGPKCLFHKFVLENVICDSNIDESTILQLAEDSGTIEKGSVKAIKQNPNILSSVTANITPEKLVPFFKTVENKYKTSQFVLSQEDEGSIKKINEASEHDIRNTALLLHNGGVCQYIYPDRESLLRAIKAEITSILHFTPCNLRHDGTHCYVPGFLKDLVESKLDDWITNAFYSRTMTKDHEYVLESHGVIPVDYSCTGVLENFMQWSDGLHQFLQMKHQDKLSDMTVITNYMYNVGLLHMYRDQIYGVTGTLGKEVEIETLQKIYNITTCYIPTHKRRKLFEVEGVIVDDEKEWLEQICEVIKAQISCTQYRGERAVLVICETIGRAKTVNMALGNSVQNKKLFISNNMDNSAIFSKALEPGDIIIATNLAGRGTDLSVSASVNAAGGLFVLQTFLPKNARVEAQAFGRTGRQGSPGSAQLIICLTHLPEQIQPLVLAKGLLSLLRNIFSLAPILKDLFELQLGLYRNGHEHHSMSETLSQILTRKSDKGIKLAKDVRDETVADELRDYLDKVVPKMKLKQELFSQYLEFVNDFYKSNNNQQVESDLSALHEFWGMWLLINVNEKNSNDDLKTKLASDLQRARDTLRNRLSPLSNLHHYTLFGNDMLKTGHFQDSINMYTRAIQQDPSWAAIAYYNRAFARLVQQDNNQSPDCIEQAIEDLEHSLRSVELYNQQNDIVSKYCKSHMDAELREALTRFDHHQQARQKVLVLFQKNIEMALGKLNRVRSTGGHVKVEERLVYFLAPMNDFLPLLALSVLSVRELRSRDQLRMHQISNHFLLDLIHEFECLNSLGLPNVYVLDTRFSMAGFFSKIKKRFGK